MRRPGALRLCLCFNGSIGQTGYLAAARLQIKAPCLNCLLAELAAKQTRDEKLPRIFDYLEGELESGLGSSGHFVGDALTIADVTVASMLSQMALVIGGPDATRWPGLAAFYDQTTARPSFEANLDALAEDVLGEEKFSQSLDVEDFNYLLSD